MSTRAGSSDPEAAGLIAYRRAWKSRAASGGTSLAVLFDEWTHIGYSPDQEERGFWLEAWTSAVPPRRLGRFLAKRSGRELVAAAREIRTILTDPGLPDWLLPPPGYKMLSAGLVRDDIEKRRLPFDVDLESSEVLDRLTRLPARKDSYRKVRVWLMPGGDGSRVPVMVGTSQIGWTTIAKTQVRRLRPKPWTRTTKVADGNLKFLLSKSGQVTAGKLKVHLPPP
jgi:hypothetical protein